MRLEDLNWMDVEKYLEHEDRLMLVTGATEQHAYLSLLTDIKVPLALADAASQATGILVAPPLNFGISTYFLAYPGTLSLRSSTLSAAVEDIVRSAYGHGFRRILVINGHGGNAPRARICRKSITPCPSSSSTGTTGGSRTPLKLSPSSTTSSPRMPTGWKPFRSPSSATCPRRTKVPPKSRVAIMDAQTARSVYGDGSFGGPYRAGEDVMHELFAAALEDILATIKVRLALQACRNRLMCTGGKIPLIKLNVRNHVY